MNLLALSTSGPQASAALVLDGQVARQALGPAGKTHSETLMRLVEEALGGLDLAQIGRFAVDVGPGSFTGVRIGVCAANALAMACSKPVTGVSSLRALAFGLTGDVCALLDCRNGNGYALLLRDGAPTLPESAVVIGELLGRVPPKTLFVGDGALLHRAAIAAAVTQARFIERNQATAGAVGLCALALPGMEEVTPLYLRPSQAERLYKEKRP